METNTQPRAVPACPPPTSPTSLTAVISAFQHSLVRHVGYIIALYYLSNLDDMNKKRTVAEQEVWVQSTIKTNMKDQRIFLLSISSHIFCVPTPTLDTE